MFETPNFTCMIVQYENILELVLTTLQHCMFEVAKGKSLYICGSGVSQQNLCSIVFQPRWALILNSSQDPLWILPVKR